jgi:hypothetical protein
MTVNPTLKWSLISLGGLIVATYIVLCFLAGGPKDAIQMVRYALPYMHRGNLKVGDNAPDVKLVALDGQSRFQLHEHIAGRPLVLVFGSFT